MAAPPPAFSVRNFRVTVGDVELGLCAVSGLGLTAGGADAGPVPLTIRRAAGAGPDLFAWCEAAAAGRVDARRVRIELLDGAGGRPVVSWLLEDATPVAWRGPALDAVADAVAYEELDLTCRRLRQSSDPKELTDGRTA